MSPAATLFLLAVTFSLGAVLSRIFPKIGKFAEATVRIEEIKKSPLEIIIGGGGGLASTLGEFINQHSRFCAKIVLATYFEPAMNTLRRKVRNVSIVACFVIGVELLVVVNGFAAGKINLEWLSSSSNKEEWVLGGIFGFGIIGTFYVIALGWEVICFYWALEEQLDKARD